ncbi:MAG: PQQ-binding-like beta-propeller repeat protein [Acidobacteria bacterium]|jgi:hypothetical protein|nr:PQQ-binding-like beta-propeller repeat protein [Acidobacteriota bacterium]
MFAPVPRPGFLTVLLALAAGPPLGTAEAVVPAAGPPAVEATVSWTVELDGMATGAVRTLLAADLEAATPGSASALFLISVGGALEARRARDGSLAWRRDGLAPDGLESDPLPGAPMPVANPFPLAWAGLEGDGTARLLLLSPATGATLAAAPLDEPPAGPPLAMPARDAEGARWYLPLPRGRVAVFDRSAARVALIEMQQEITPPLMRIEGEVIAAIGPERRAARVGALPRRSAPRQIDPHTVAASNGVAVAARERGVAAWRVRPLRRGTMRFRLDWEQRLGGKVSAAPLFAPPLVLVPCWNTFLYAFEARNGHLVWRARAGHRLDTTPVRWRVFAALQPATAPTILFFDLIEGRAAGRIELGDEQRVVAAPAIAGDLLVLATSRSPAKTAELRGYALAVKNPSARSGPPG